ncbi:MAG TPA: hypothetical protein VGE04_16715 [Chloroflexia bacterium]
MKESPTGRQTNCDLHFPEALALQLAPFSYCSSIPDSCEQVETAAGWYFVNLNQPAKPLASTFNKDADFTITRPELPPKALILEL